MFYRRLFFIIAILAVSPLQARELNDKERALIAEVVTTSFKDPAAAQFRWPLMPDIEFSVTYCGLVNGKNSYGGYIGFSPFMVQLSLKNATVSGATLIDVAEPGTIDERALTAMCSKKGVDLSSVH
jgi:hypothetical protein